MVTPEQAKNLADLLESFTDGQTVDQCVFALRDLADQVEALQADAARMQWMQDNPSRIKIYVYDDDGDPCSGDWHYKPHDLRKIVDAAAREQS